MGIGLLGERKATGGKTAGCVVCWCSIREAWREGWGEVHEGVWRWEDVVEGLVGVGGGGDGGWRLALAGGPCGLVDDGLVVAQAHGLTCVILHRLASVCRRRKREHH